MSVRPRLALRRLIHRSRHHPLMTSPLAIRVSKWSLSFIFLAYAVVSLLWAAVVGAGCWLMTVPAESAPAAAREGLAALWAPENLILKPGQLIPFYLLATMNAFVSVLLPLLVLGSFVYKLFGQDPIVWRGRLSLEASPPESHPIGSFVLVARFYNQIRVDAADVRVRAWLRFTTAEYNPNVLLNKRLEFLVRGQRVEDWVLPLMRPTDVTAVRVLLCPYSESLDPVTEKDIYVQGETVSRATASIALIAEGTLVTLNETFRSVANYQLDDEIDTDVYQDISLGTVIAKEWSNFEGVQWSYVFFYGEAMTQTALDALGVRAEDTGRARLTGWRRAWNVVDGDEAAVSYQHADGSSFAGLILKLGVERSDDGVKSVLGVVARVRYPALAILDSQETEYIRTDITREIVWGTLSPNHAFRAFVYAPRTTLIDAFVKMRDGKELAISQRYLDSVRSASVEVDEECTKDLERAMSEIQFSIVTPGN